MQPSVHKTRNRLEGAKRSADAQSLSTPVTAGPTTSKTLGLAQSLQLGSGCAASPHHHAASPEHGMTLAFDEMTGADGAIRPSYSELARWLAEIPPDTLDFRRREAEVLFRRIGITFAVYGEADAQERLI